MFEKLANAERCFLFRVYYYRWLNSVLFAFKFSIHGNQVSYFQVFPVQKPVIIRLGDDSSEEEEEKVCPSPFGVQKLLGGLDMFLKEARRSSEIVSSVFYANFMGSQC